MPTYLYECEACEHRLEKFQMMSDDALTTCPECSEEKLVRLIGGGAGLIFKGSGFYETDYKRAPKKEASESQSSPCGSSACGKAEKTNA